MIVCPFCEKECINASGVGNHISKMHPKHTPYTVGNECYQKVIFIDEFVQHPERYPGQTRAIKDAFNRKRIRLVDFQKKNIKTNIKKVCDYQFYWNNNNRPKTENKKENKKEIIVNSKLKYNYTEITKNLIRSLNFDITKIVNEQEKYNILLCGETQYQKSNGVNHLICNTKKHIVLTLPDREASVVETVRRLELCKLIYNVDFEIYIIGPPHKEKTSEKAFVTMLNEKRMVFVIMGNHKRLGKASSNLVNALHDRKHRENDVILVRDESDLVADELVNRFDHTNLELAMQTMMTTVTKIIHVTATPAALYLRTKDIPDCYLLPEPQFYTHYRSFNYQIIDEIHKKDYYEIYDVVRKQFSMNGDNVFIYNREVKEIHEKEAKRIINKFKKDTAVITVSGKNKITLYYDSETINTFDDVQEASTEAYNHKKYLVYLAGIIFGRQMSISDSKGLYPVRCLVIKNKSVTNGSYTIQIVGRLTGSYPNKNNINSPIIFTGSKKIEDDIKAWLKDNTNLMTSMFNRFPNGGTDSEKIGHLSKFITWNTTNKIVPARMMNGWKYRTKYAVDHDLPLLSSFVHKAEIRADYADVDVPTVIDILIAHTDLEEKDKQYLLWYKNKYGTKYIHNHKIRRYISPVRAKQYGYIQIQEYGVLFSRLDMPEYHQKELYPYYRFHTSSGIIKDNRQEVEEKQIVLGKEEP